MTLQQQEPTLPITPREARKQMISSIPPEIIKIFNDMIAEKASGRGRVRVNLLQCDIVKRIEETHTSITRKLIFEKHWLDVEPLFEKAGWKVRYDKPCYYGGDNYEANYTFEEKPEDGC